MTYGDRYTLHLKSLPQGISYEEYRLEDEFWRGRPQFELLGGVVDVRLSIDRVGEVYQMLFELSGALSTTCDRCLSQVSMPVEARHRLIVKQGDEYSEVSEEEIIVPHTDPNLDISDLLFEYALLSLPINRTHPDGYCTPEMQSILDDLQPDSNASDQRWGTLAQLRDHLQESLTTENNKTI